MFFLDLLSFIFFPILKDNKNHIMIKKTLARDFNKDLQARVRKNKETGRKRQCRGREGEADHLS